ncbi:MAG: hypothetical protein ACFB3T_03480 [Geminicoccaceae bacterium]
MQQTLTALWRGERPLPVTFWLYALPAVVVIDLLRVSYAEQIGLPRQSLAEPMLLVLHLIGGVVRAFLMVAIWRSASRFKGSLFWPTAARLIWMLVLAEWALRLSNLPG